MTREETIEFGNMWLEINEDSKDSNTYEFFRMAINTLKQEPCEDCISRQAVLDLVVVNHTELNGVNVVMYSPLYKDIKQLPSVTPQPKTGHWITKSHGFPPEPSSVCSECGFDRDFYIRARGFDKINYCPNCGAKMEVEE